MDLCTASSRGAVQQAQTLLQTGIDPNTSSTRWNARLACTVDSSASSHENNDENADSDVYMALPLHLAVIHGHYDMVQLLLDHGASMTKKDSRDRTAIICCIYGSCDTLTITSQNQLIVTKTTSNHIAIMRLLLRILVKDTPDMFDECANNPQSGKLLRGVTPLCLAAYLGKSEMVRTLIQSGAMANAQDLNGSTPLMYAAREGHIKVIDVLLYFNALPLIQDNYGWTTIQYAAPFPHIVNMLNAKQSTLNTASTSIPQAETVNIDSTPSSYPVLPRSIQKNSAMVSPLNKVAQLPPSANHHKVYPHYFESNTVNNQETITPSEQYTLYSSIKDGDTALLNTVLSGPNAHKAVQYTDPQSGLTALQYAVRHRPLRAIESVQIVLMLIQKGAVASTPNYKTNKCALHYILRNPYMMKKVDEQGEIAASTSSMTAEKEKTELELLKLAVYEIVKILLDAGALPSGADGTGNHPLHYACQTGEIQLVQLLLEYGADVFARNRKGRTAMQECLFPEIRFLLETATKTQSTGGQNTKITHGTDNTYSANTIKPESAVCVNVHTTSPTMETHTTKNQAKRAITNLSDMTIKNPNDVAMEKDGSVLQAQICSPIPSQIIQGGIPEVVQVLSISAPTSLQSNSTPISSIQTPNPISTPQLVQEPQTDLADAEIQASDHTLMKQIYRSLRSSSSTFTDLPNTDTLTLFKQLLADSDLRCMTLEHELDQAISDKTVCLAASQDHIRRLEQDVLIAEARTEKSSKEVLKLRQEVASLEKKLQGLQGGSEALMMAYQKSLDMSHRLANDVDEKQEMIGKLKQQIYGGHRDEDDETLQDRTLVMLDLLCSAAQFQVDAIVNDLDHRKESLESVKAQRIDLLTRAGKDKVEPLESDEDLLGQFDDAERVILDSIEQCRASKESAQSILDASIKQYTYEKTQQADPFENIGSDVTAHDKDTGIEAAVSETWSNKFTDIEQLLDTLSFESTPPEPVTQDFPYSQSTYHVYVKATAGDGTPLRVPLTMNIVARLLRISHQTLRLKSHTLHKSTEAAQKAQTRLDQTQQKLQETARRLLNAKNELKDLSSKFLRMDNEMVEIECKLDVVNASRVEEIRSLRQLVDILVGGSCTSWESSGTDTKEQLKNGDLSIQEHEGLVGAVKHMLASVDAKLLRDKGIDIAAKGSEVPESVALASHAASITAGQKDADLHRYALQALAVVHISLHRLQTYCDSIGVALHALQTENNRLKMAQSESSSTKNCIKSIDGGSSDCLVKMADDQQTLSVPTTSVTPIDATERNVALPSTILTSIPPTCAQLNASPPLAQISTQPLPVLTPKPHDREQLVVSVSPITPLFDSSIWSEYPFISNHLQNESSETSSENAFARAQTSTRTNSIDPYALNHQRVDEPMKLVLQPLPRTASRFPTQLHSSSVPSVSQVGLGPLRSPGSMPEFDRVVKVDPQQNSLSSDDSNVPPVMIVEKSIAMMKGQQGDDASIQPATLGKRPAGGLSATGKVSEYLDALESLKADMIGERGRSVSNGTSSTQGLNSHNKKLAYKDMVRKLIAAMKAESGVANEPAAHFETDAGNPTALNANTEFLPVLDCHEGVDITSPTQTHSISDLGFSRLDTRQLNPHQLEMVDSTQIVADTVLNSNTSEDEIPISELVARNEPLDNGTSYCFNDRRMCIKPHTLTVSTKENDVNMSRPSVEFDKSAALSVKSPLSPLKQAYIDINARLGLARPGI
ncbi:hypothetical protein BDV3_000455 [Batrachochytrium dendrobatidis]